MWFILWVCECDLSCGCVCVPSAASSVFLTYSSSSSAALRLLSASAAVCSPSADTLVACTETVKKPFERLYWTLWDQRCEEETNPRNEPTSVTRCAEDKKQQETLDLTSLGPARSKNPKKHCKTTTFPIWRERSEGQCYTSPKGQKKKKGKRSWCLTGSWTPVMWKIWNLSSLSRTSIQETVKGSLQRKWAELMQHFRLWTS